MIWQHLGATVAAVSIVFIVGLIAGAYTFRNNTKRPSK